MTIDDDDDDDSPLFEEPPPIWTAERVLRASYKDLGTPNQVQDRFRRYLLSCRSDQLEALYQASSSTTRDYSLEIDAFQLLQKDTVLGCLLLKYPTTLLPLLEKALVDAQIELFHRDNNERDVAVTGTVKGDPSAATMTRVHARLVHLPPTCTKSSLHDLKAEDVGRIWQVQGTVVRTLTVQMYESARTYTCSGKNGCGRSFVISADLEQEHNALQTPNCCPLLNGQGQPCRGTQLQKVASVHTDYQECKIQEAASLMSMGHIPRSLLIKLQHDLVDTCQPGDQVVIVGSLLAQWPPSVIPDVDCVVGMALEAHSIRVVQEKGGSVWNNKNDLGEIDRLQQEFETYWLTRRSIRARDFICQAICPKLYGMSMVKLALLVTLIGGVSVSTSSSGGGSQERGEATALEEEDDHDEPDQFRIHTTHTSHKSNDFYQQDRRTTNNHKSAESVQTRRRDQSHMLLVGDPGTGKSQVLRFAAALCPRSVLTTGVGTTSAGLTCAAVRDGNGKEFCLEAGALVLADKGVCCIDEFGCIGKEDRTTIHEAMEQQTLSVAKAGIVCKLNCRATIIAVMNPKDCLYDNLASLSRNTGLGTPLLSRFDIIFKLLDTSDATRDSNITTHLLNRAITGAGFDCSENTANPEEQPWSMDKLRAYISIVKDKFNPTLSSDAALLLERHYEKCRSAENQTIPVTVRFLESMIRLSQAHARLMWRNAVTLEDAVAVIRIMECSAFCYGGFDGQVEDVHNVLYQDPMTMEFSPNADLEFLAFMVKILERYGLIDRMPPGDRRKALEYINAGVVADGSSWDNRASQNDSSWQTHAQSNMNAHEDHYGRYHFNTQSGRSRSNGSDQGRSDEKRRRFDS